MIAGLPAPDGLVDRVQTRLRTVPRSARLLSWPMVFLRRAAWGYGAGDAGSGGGDCMRGGRVEDGGFTACSAGGERAACLRCLYPRCPARGFSTAGSVRHTRSAAGADAPDRDACQKKCLRPPKRGKTPRSRDREEASEVPRPRHSRGRFTPTDPTVAANRIQAR